MCTFSEFKLPPADGTPDDGEFENLKYSISRMGRAFTTEEFRLTKAAIAGMVGHEAKDYEPGQCIAFLFNTIENSSGFHLFFKVLC